MMQFEGTTAPLCPRSQIKRWLPALMMIAAIGGCGGGKGPILGSGAVVAAVAPGAPVTPITPASTPPTVTATAPANNATSVATDNTVINAAFSEAVAPLTGSASFTVTCAAPCTSPSGTTALDASGKIATYSLPLGTTLLPQTVYTGTITAAKSVATGLTLASPYVWRFTTGVTTDTTRPRVSITVPGTTTPGPTTGVATNTAINAVFTEDMAPATITGTSFTLTCSAPCVAPTGVVSYAVGTRTAVFTPAAGLAASTTYTATVTTAATDLAGNALAGNQAALPAASNYVWVFTTAAAAVVTPVGNVTVVSTVPAAGATNVCTTATVNATFGVPSGLRISPASVTSSTFTVSAAGPVPVVAASVVLDNATGRIATFTPLAPLTAGVQYTAKLTGGSAGIKDQAIPANTLANDFSWNFTAVSCAATVNPVINLGSASTFGTFGGTAGMTNSGTLTIVNGDIGTTAVSTAVTGFHDTGAGCTYTETPLNQGFVNGTIYTAAPPPTVACPSEGTAVTFAIAQQAAADALSAYNALVALPGGPDPGAGNLANLVLAPGVYTAASGSFMITGGNLTLDAKGDANAVFVFQMASTLTVGGPGAPSSIILVNGAQAKNVFWQVGTAATINAAGGGTMVGTIIARAGAPFSTAGNVTPVILNGRALSLGASVTLVNTIINVPAP